MIIEQVVREWRPTPLTVRPMQEPELWPIDYAHARNKNLLTGRRGRFYDYMVIGDGPFLPEDVILLFTRVCWGYLQ